MAIVYPRPFPPLAAFATSSMRIVRTEAAAMLSSGAAQTMQLAPPRWRCEYITKPASWRERRVWRAWLDSLGGALRTFVGYDPLQIWPGAYPGGFAGMTRAAGGAFAGQGEATAITATTISITGLPASFILGEGDLVGLVQGGRYGLHRILEAVTGGGDGTATVTVEPPVLTSAFTAGAVVNFARPACELMLDPATPPDTSAELNRKPVTFSAIQRIY